MIKAMGNDVTGMDKETYYKNTLVKLNDPKYIDSEIKNYECDNSNRSITMVKDLNDLKKALIEVKRSNKQLDYKDENKKITEAEDMSKVRAEVSKAVDQVKGNTEAEIDQVKGNLEVLKTDEEEAIAGYDTFIDNAGKVVDKELADTLDDQMQEIIDDEKEHIEKLDTIKSALGERKKTEKAVSYKSVTESKEINGRFLIWLIYGKLYILETDKKYKTMPDAVKFFDKYVEVNNIDLSKFDEKTINNSKNQICYEMRFADISVSDDGKAIFYHERNGGGTQPIEDVIWVSEDKTKITEAVELKSAKSESKKLNETSYAFLSADNKDLFSNGVVKVLVTSYKLDPQEADVKKFLADNNIDIRALPKEDGDKILNQRALTYSVKLSEVEKKPDGYTMKITGTLQNICNFLSDRKVDVDNFIEYNTDYAIMLDKPIKD